MGTPQPGIFVLGTRAHRHLEFSRRSSASPAQLLAGLRRAHAAGVPLANVVVGCSPALWRAVAGDETPCELADFPVVPGMPSTQRDLWVWCHGTDQDALLDAGLAVAAALDDVADLAFELQGFVYHDSRDLTGFIDGTENPGPDEAPEVALVPAGAPGAGGSFALTQQWVHHLDRWVVLEQTEQEAIIGRTKPDSVELDESVMPPDSHVSRTVVEGDDGEELAIFRRSVPYGTVAEHGLHFVAFSATPQRITIMLERMFGVGDGVHDRIIEFSTPITGSYWFVPAVESLADVQD